MRTKGICQYFTVFLRAFHFTDFINLFKCVCYLFALLCLGCSPFSEKKNEVPFHRQEDRFPHKAIVKYAKGFSISYFNNYKIVSVFNPFKKDGDTVRYVLVQRGTSPPKGFDPHTIVEIPIRNMICFSTTHIALTDFLDANELVTGLSNTEAVCNKQIRERIKDKKIMEVGRSETMNKELVISMEPDLVMVVGQPEGRAENHQLLEDSGITVLTNSEWMETSPLGRTEWVKLLAAFLNKEQLAEEKFNNIEQQYLGMVQLTRSVKYKPSVITGNTYKGTWSVSGGNSYVANLLKDAGADYYWANDTTRGSITLSLELIYELALRADYWLIPGSAKTLEDIATQDVRFRQFKMFIHGNIFNNMKTTCEGGGNEYWESGLVRPHLVLSDLIKIFHPELLQEHETIYFNKLKNAS